MSLLLTHLFFFFRCVVKLSNNRRVNLSEFKGRLFVNIREYFNDQAGEPRPGKKVMKPMRSRNPPKAAPPPNPAC